MKKHTNLQIGENIKSLRHCAGWSQSELSRRAGVTSAAISMVEKGGRIPSIPLLLSISGALKIPLSNLIKDENSAISDKEITLFFRRFMDISYLDEHDQAIILKLAKRLRMNDDKL